MSELTPVFLPIHVLTAIVAFGPGFVMPLIARMAAQEPQHGLFALRLTDRMLRRVVIPAALTMPISGGLLVWSEGIDLASTHWLLAAIGLYAAAIAYAVLVQVGTVDRMIQLAGQMAAAGPALAAGPGAALAQPAVSMSVPASRYASPAAEMRALAARARNGGFFLVAMVIVIVSLMAGKPAI